MAGGLAIERYAAPQAATRLRGRRRDGLFLIDGTTNGALTAPRIGEGIAAGAAASLSVLQPHNWRR
jgi:hypothetical protein